MSNSRRDFLKASGLVVMAGAAGFLSTEEFVRANPNLSSQYKPSSHSEPDAAAKARADRPQPSTLVTIFLRGGADMLNAFVPFGDDLYYKYRPKIAIPRSAKGMEEAVAKLGKGTYWGVNPRMAEIIPLIEKGVVVPIVNVGSPDGTRSHFSAQDNMERGCVTGQSTARGWLNRYLELTKKPYDAPLRGLSAQTLVPRALRGNYPVLAGNNRTEQMDLFEKLYSSQNMVNITARDSTHDEHGSSLEDLHPGMDQKGALTSDMTRDVITMSGTNAVERIKALQIAQETPSDADYPNGGLGSQLATIARVIKANVGLEVAQADFGGWDMHAGEGATNGRMGTMVQQLAGCITAFNQDLGKRMDKVMLLVMSEFGRTVEENGAQGTDHGRGGWMLACGNMMNGGNFYGKWNGLVDSDGGRFQPVHTDFRAVYAEALYKLFGFEPFRADIFPGYKGSPADSLNFMQPVKQG